MFDLVTITLSILPPAGFLFYLLFFVVLVFLLAGLISRNSFLRCGPGAFVMVIILATIWWAQTPRYAHARAVYSGQQPQADRSMRWVPSPVAKLLRIGFNQRGAPSLFSNDGVAGPAFLFDQTEVSPH